MNEPGAEAVKETTANTYNPVCNACMVLFQWDELTEVPCNHRYCPGCIKFFFTRAMKDETFYPPACCSAKIPVRVVSKRLTKTFARRYKAKLLELKTQNKTYCHRPACSAFIAPHSIHNGNACCQRCGSITCAACKSGWHWGRCLEDDGTGFFEFIKSTEWKRCPECKRMVEKNEVSNMSQPTKRNSSV